MHDDTNHVRWCMYDDACVMMHDPDMVPHQRQRGNNITHIIYIIWAISCCCRNFCCCRWYAAVACGRVLFLLLFLLFHMWNSQVFNPCCTKAARPALTPGATDGVIPNIEATTSFLQRQATAARALGWCCESGQFCACTHKQFNSMPSSNKNGAAVHTSNSAPVHTSTFLT